MLLSLLSSVFAGLCRGDWRHRSAIPTLPVTPPLDVYLAFRYKCFTIAKRLENLPFDALVHSNRAHITIQYMYTS